MASCAAAAAVLWRWCGAVTSHLRRRRDQFSLLVPLFMASMSPVLLPLCYYILPLLRVGSLWRHRQQAEVSWTMPSMQARPAASP